ncbi:MAG: PQQ-binding-like beta-propeller repeat protein [Planctomycetales bacterium]|nr:PQQ-binding-like beta-propeller repeat protein [Planctomycetales bacterium]
MNRRLASVCFGVMFVGAWATSDAADWSRFRGPNGSGVSDERGLPDRWSDSENLLWKLELPGSGSSSPITVGDRIFVTCYSGYGVSKSEAGDQAKLERNLVCVNARDGKIEWQKSMKAKLPEERYGGMIAEHGYASSTPASDSERVYVFCGKSGVHAFDLKGKLQWQADVGSGSAMNNWGSGTSVVLHKNLVILNADAESEAIIALDKVTGKEVWRASAKGYKGSWSTPIVVDVGGKQELVVIVPGEVWGLDPSDGGLLWFCEARQGASSSAVTRDGVVYAIAGGPGGSGAIAIRAGGRDDVTKSHVVWQKNVGAYVPSPVLVGNHLCWVDDRGVAYCYDAKTGDEIYRERLPDAGGVYASVVAADGKIFAVTRRRGTFVLGTGKKLEQIAQNKFGSDDTDFNASPAIGKGQLLLRSNRQLYCVGTK